MKVSITAGQNAVSELDPCCYLDVRPPECSEEMCDSCLLDVMAQPCNVECCYQIPLPPGCDPIDDCAGCCPRVDHPDWRIPDSGARCCDDDPILQREATIAAAWWNPDVVLAVFIDYFRNLNAFTISIDGGQTWKRFDRENEFYPEPICEGPIPALVNGYGQNQDDIWISNPQCEEQCHEGCAEIEWPAGNADPCTATGQDGEETGYLYFTGGAPYFVRIAFDIATGLPSSLWEAVVVPAAPEAGVGDKPFISSNPEGGELYVTWIAARAPLEGDSETDVFLTASCAHGNEFFERGSCEDFSPSLGVPLSYLNFGGSNPHPRWGTSSAVGPEGEVHFIWPVRDDALTPGGLDQIYLRSLIPNESTGILEYVPPLPAGTECELEPVRTCELPIIEGQPGITGPGYDGAYVGRAASSLNFTNLTHPTIAIDRRDRALQPCSFGGYIYVAYAAENPIFNDIDNYVDTNIYVVRSRDRGVTWSKPMRIEPVPRDAMDVPEDAVETTCTTQQAACGKTATGGRIRRPIQFYPWIAVDQQGRVGLMWHDTYPDYANYLQESDPCDGNIIYNTHFAYSLDGGVTWEWGWEINDTPSQTGRGTFPWNTCEARMVIGEYSGLTATSTTDVTATGTGIFHAIWQDARGYTTSMREIDELLEQPKYVAAIGDIYTTSVTIDDLVYSMGDFDRDYDVDFVDFERFASCAEVPLPPKCEILDFNRNNEIDNDDISVFLLDCYNNSPGAGGGESASAGAGEASTEQGLTPMLQAMIDWCSSSMSVSERRELAANIRELAACVDVSEGPRMSAFADAIDPVE